MGYSPWGRKQSDTTERLHFLFSFLNFKIEKYVVFYLLSGQSPASSIILLLWSFYYSGISTHGEKLFSLGPICLPPQDPKLASVLLLGFNLALETIASWKNDHRLPPVEVVEEGALCVFCLDGGPPLSVPLSLPRPASWQAQIPPVCCGGVDVSSWARQNPGLFVDLKAWYFWVVRGRGFSGSTDWVPFSLSLGF